MLSGTINFTAKITGNGLTFQRFAFNPNVANLPSIEIEAPDGYTLNITAHVDRVATANAATDLARPEIEKALNRLAVERGITIQPTRPTGHQLRDVDAANGLNMIGGDIVMFMDAVEAVVEIRPADVKALLESAPLPGEQHYPMLRHASQSASPVEQFTHLYTILLTLYDDEQADVDAFIVSEEPNVAQSQQPPTRRRPRLGRWETSYSRLRNELSHRRPGIDMANTKAEATAHVPALRALVKRAIALHP